MVLNSNEVLIICGINNNLYGRILTINEETITIGKEVNIETELDVNYNTNNVLEAVLIDINKVFIEVRKDNSLYAFICVIDGETITVETEIKLETSASSMLTVLIDTNKVLTLFQDNSNTFGFICTINGTTITKSERINIATQNILNTVSVVSSNKNKIFIAFQKDTCIYGIICTINGTAITTSEIIKIKDNLGEELNSAQSIKADISAIWIDPDKVFILCKDSCELHKILCAIHEDKIRIISSTTSNIKKIDGYLSDYNEVASLLINNKVFLLYGHRFNLYGIIENINYIEKFKNTDGIILGIAKNSGTEGDTIKIIVPE